MTTAFFKIILSTDPRLRLPHKFVSKYKGSIPRVVSVDGPYGPAFQVELTPSHGDIWLDKGFQPFMDYYSIKPGYLILFNCDFEASFFHVTIFDQSATEIDHPLTSFKGKHPNKTCCQREETEVITAEISRKREISKRKELEETEDDLSIEILEEDNGYEVSGRFMNDISRKGEPKKLEKIKTWQKSKQNVKPKKLTAHERAKSFISIRPSFVSFMHPCYIAGHLSISKRFALEFIKVKTVCDVVLMVLGGTRTWTVKCYVASRDVKLRWRTFVKDNGLSEGDACVFELGNGITPTLNVIIFRSTEEAELKGNLRNTDFGEIFRNQKNSKGKKLKEIDDDDVSIKIMEKIPTLEDMDEISGKREIENLEEITTWQKLKQTLKPKKLTAHERAKAFITTRPCVVCFMHRSYIDGNLTINKIFAVEMIKVKSSCNVVLRVPGDTRTWTAKCYVTSNNAKLSWNRFVKDNGLCVGDACVLELENDITPSLNVIIFHSTEEEKVKVNRRNTDLGEIPRKLKFSKGMKEEVDDVPIVEEKETTKKELKKEAAAKVTKREVTQRSKPSEKAPEKTSSSEAFEDQDKYTNSSAKEKSDAVKEKSSLPKTSSSGKKLVKGKEKTKGEEFGPNDDELRVATFDILKEVDLNTATFTDVLKQLAKRFDKDLVPRKSFIKLIIQEESTRLAVVVEDDDNDEDSGNEMQPFW